MTVVAAKLGIKPGMRVWVSDPELADLIGQMPAGATTSGSDFAASPLAIIRATGSDQLGESLDAIGADLIKPAAVWIFYPKGNRIDLNRDSLWPILAARGMRPNRQVAVDGQWSALRFRATQPGEAPFAPGKG